MQHPVIIKWREECTMATLWIVLLRSWCLLGWLLHGHAVAESTVPAGLHQAAGCVVPASPNDPNRFRQPFTCCDGWALHRGKCVTVSKTCPKGYSQNDLGGCFKVMTLTSSWEESRKACQQDSQSDLAIVDTSEELERLISLSRGIQQNIWIGLREAPLIKSLVWVDGSLATPSDDLAPLLPQINTPPESSSVLRVPKCVGINTASGLLEQRECGTHAASVCKLRSQCPRGFSQYYEGHCYRYVTDRPVPWRLARKECQKSPGGELAIAKKHPVSESQFLLSRVQPEIQDLWLGLYHDSQSGVWRWVDGTPLSKKQGQVWNLGEPNNLSGHENCAEISSHQAKWNDSDCNKSFPYVCEIQENSECYTNVNGIDYSGHVNISTAGSKCVEWNRDDLRALNVAPISDADWLELRGHNHCRNPGGFRDSTWCNVDRRSSGSVSWKPCYIGEPQVTCVQGETRSSALSYATPCTVESSCSNGHTCHPVMRECICPSGYHGESCQRPCTPGTYGYQCDLTCPSCPGGVTCHHVTGNCLQGNTDVTESNGGNRPVAGSCSGICLLAVKVGCVCDNTSGSCPCPAYVIALLAVAIVTWVVLGFGCLACGILRRRRNSTRVEYKRDSDYCEEIGTDSDTDDELENQQVSGHQTHGVVSQPTVGASVGVMDNFESSTRALLHDTSLSRLPPVPTAPLPTAPVLQSDSPPNNASPPESPFYLNVSRYRDETEYSNPYEFFGREPVWRRSAPGPDEVWEPFLFRPVPNHDELNNAPNGYVNDSVIKLKEKKRTNKHGHPMPYRLRFSFRSKELERNGEAETQQKRTFRQKPALKPKPDSIKLRPPYTSGKCPVGTRINSAGASTLSRRSDPQGCTTRHDEFELKIIGQHSPIIANRNGDATRRHKIQRGTSVPNSGSSCRVDPDIDCMTSPWGWKDEKSSDSHVYVNEKIGRPRVGKARSVDEFGA